MDKSYRVVPKFISGAAEQLFTIEWCPAGNVKGFILFVPPFADEMNRSRQMVSRQARLFAEHGYRVVVPDLTGTGDSYGGFAEVAWDDWSQDLVRVAEASRPEEGLPFIVWTLRLGALLALHSIRQNNLRADKLLLWSPCPNGASFMTQFLRLRLMSSMIGRSGGKERLSDLKDALIPGFSVEVAGYELSSDLYRSISELDIIQLMAGMTIPASWFELIADRQSGLPVVAANATNALMDANCRIEVEAVVGPKFWTTVETTVSDELAKRTLYRLGA